MAFYVQVELSSGFYRSYFAYAIQLCSRLCETSFSLRKLFPSFLLPLPCPSFGSFMIIVGSSIVGVSGICFKRIRNNYVRAYIRAYVRKSPDENSLIMKTKLAFDFSLWQYCVSLIYVYFSSSYHSHNDFTNFSAGVLTRFSSYYLHIAWYQM